MRKKIVFISLFLSCLPFAIIDSSAANPDIQMKVDSLCSAALDHTHHGRFEESDSVISVIMSEFNLSKKGVATMYGLLGQNAWLSGNYPLFYQCLSKSLNRKELRKQKIPEALSRLPRETLERPKEDVHVKYALDSLFYQGVFKGCEMRLPTMIGGMEEMMLLDNGCAFFSIASETFAEEHGIKPTGIEWNVTGVVKKIPMWIGIADSLSIASLSFKNILFGVISDEYLQNPVTKIDAVLGANIFRLAGEMDFNNLNREIVIPYEQETCDSNIMIDEKGCHYVDTVVGEDTLKFQLDLGSATTDFNSNYYTRYKERIVKECAADTKRVGGIGGFTDSLQVYRMDNVEIEACGGCYSIQNACISTTKMPNEGNEFGVVGLDFLLYFDRARLNLKTMHLKVE